MSQTKNKNIPAISHHQATEKRSYQYNKLYSTIDLHYAITFYFELLRAFLDIPPLSIVGPSRTQSTSSSLPPNRRSRRPPLQTYVLDISQNLLLMNSKNIL